MSMNGKNNGQPAFPTTYSRPINPCTYRVNTLSYFSFVIAISQELNIIISRLFNNETKILFIVKHQYLFRIYVQHNSKSRQVPDSRHNVDNIGFLGSQHSV